jgi:pantetheine-phosphate adenylyltransferase
MREALAVYPGTFDPFTRGHEDLVRRAAGLFERVIVAVAKSETKKPLFSLPERIELAQRCLSDCDTVSVMGFDGLVVDFLTQHQGHVLLRGLRAVSDFEYEFQMAGMNRTLCPGAETLFMTPSSEYLFLSASVVREIARFGGDVRGLVHPHVALALAQKYAPAT